MPAQYTIGAVAERTGLTVHTLRAWERRHGVPSPSRTGTNRRLYSPDEVERISKLSQLVKKGHAISQIANLPDATLDELLTPKFSQKTAALSPGAIKQDWLVEAIGAIRMLSDNRLDEVLTRATTHLGIPSALDSVILPLVQWLDIAWSRQEIMIAHEHLASAVIRTFLERIRLTIDPPTNAPRMIVSTPSGQIHELGALIVSMHAALEGWDVVYLGPNTPAPDLIEAVSQAQAQALCLSVVYPVEDPLLLKELEALHMGLPTRFPIIVGGRAVDAIVNHLSQWGIYGVQDLNEFKTILRNVVGRGQA